MVKVKEDYPLLQDGRIDHDTWIAKTFISYPAKFTNLIRKSCEVANSHARNHDVIVKALDVVEILVNLSSDRETIAAGMLFMVLRENQVTISEINLNVDSNIIDLVQQTNQIDDIQSGSVAKHSLQNFRKMLLAVVNDVRVVVIKLAEHTCLMRNATKFNTTEQKQLAKITQEIYAPLANRLGIGQIKWELEDLAFRFMEPKIYKSIAKLLNERRINRQKFIDNIICTLRQALTSAGIAAKIYGRAKHIYSIWNKMQRKMVSYSEIYDVRAIRAIVPDVSDCYATLGIVHSIWQHIPKEFDDYIANPKQNGYQSLHTAVIGNLGKVMEIQIRTESMHELAELGVAAHWKYKEPGQTGKDDTLQIANLRQILNLQEEFTLDLDTVESLREEYFADRVYVFTPSGEIIDLPRGATPIDFAYHIHTQIGHLCRGAKVDGKMVPLTYKLSSGDQVEILTSKEGGPSRDWLNTHLGFVITTKAKAKLFQWFKKQDVQQNIHDGREMLNRELKRLNLSNICFKDIAKTIDDQYSEDELLSGLGCGDIRISQVINALHRMQRLTKLPYVEVSKKNSTPASQGDFEVNGIGNLVAYPAQCCNPIYGDEILGYVTNGQGVSVHRKDCINILDLENTKFERIVEVNWGQKSKNLHRVSLSIEAYNRRNLLQEITTVVAYEKSDIIEINSSSQDGNTLLFKLVVEIPDVQVMSRIINRLLRIPNVVDVCRISTQ